MNLAHNPTEKQLAELLARVDDTSDSHVLWVGQTGEVHLDPVRSTKQLSEGQPIWFGPEARFRWETFGQGNNYVGKSAASDSAWVHRLYKEIIFLWESGFTGYSDYWQAP
jgi:hypothetical protein